MRALSTRLPIGSRGWIRTTDPGSRAQSLTAWPPENDWLLEVSRSRTVGRRVDDRVRVVHVLINHSPAIHHLPVAIPPDHLSIWIAFRKTRRRVGLVGVVILPLPDSLLGIWIALTLIRNSCVGGSRIIRYSITLRSRRQRVTSPLLLSRRRDQPPYAKGTTSTSTWSSLSSYSASS